MKCIVHIFMPQGAYLALPFDAHHPNDISSCVDVAIQEMMDDNPSITLRDIRLEISFE
jgi:hypothetical protein